MGKQKIVHVELATESSEKAAKFYADVFGWEIQTDEALGYTMFNSGDLSGGFSDIDNQSVKKGDVVMYLDSEDIDTDMTRIESHGGKRLTDNMVIPGNGIMAHFIDPDGNHLALWQSTEEENAE
ncbi:MAG: VOC family protein [Chloroflexota bacterium]